MLILLVASILVNIIVCSALVVREQKVSALKELHFTDSGASYRAGYQDGWNVGKNMKDK